MTKQLLGIHHVTAIVEDPDENVAFYTRVLGLRLVKRTVNYDDPATYHLYYGDEAGSPGTIVTFFPWPAGPRGSHGSGQISAFAFAVPAGALAFWQQHLPEVGIRFGGPEQRWGAPALALYDPAGLLIELVEQPEQVKPAPTRNGIPAEAAIQRLLGVTLTVAAIEPTSAFLAGALGFEPVESADAHPRYALGPAQVELVERPNLPRGEIAAGSIHHVAWRVADQPALEEWRSALAEQGASVTEVRDRTYFRSIYFREPGGVLFELATDPPGFTADEPPDKLGERLQLPAWLEPHRAPIERRLPALAARFM